MAKHLLLLFFSFSTLIANSSQLQQDELKKVYSLTKTNLDSAYELSYELLKECNSNEDYFGLVKLNYLLAFLHHRDENIGKSLLHYLEAIRYSENANYEGSIKDAIDMRHNIANLYRIYKTNNLAIQYYKEAIEMADWIDDKKKSNYSKFNLALTLKQDGRGPEAISLFQEMLPSSSEKTKNRIINEIGLIYKDLGDFESSKLYFEKLLNIDEKYKIYTAKALHNLGLIEYEIGSINNAIDLINESIDVKESIEGVDQRSLFISHKTLGDYLFEQEEHGNALQTYESAEKLIDEVKNEAISYELYRSMSQLNYEIGRPDAARNYSNLYSKTIDDYIQSQQNLQEIDRQYNMDLITKRWEDQVAKQEQIASILLYSKIISGSLLSLLLLTIGFNWYQKARLRKSILEDLIKLKVID